MFVEEHSCLLVKQISSHAASRQQALDSSLSTVSTMSTDSALDNAEIVSIIPSADDACVSAIPPRAAASNRSPPGMSAPDSPFDASGVDTSGVRAAVWAVEEEEEEVVYACRCKLCGRPKRAPASHCPCPRLPDGSAAEQWQPPGGDSGVKIKVRHVPARLRATAERVVCADAEHVHVPMQPLRQAQEAGGVQVPLPPRAQAEGAAEGSPVEGGSAEGAEQRESTASVDAGASQAGASGRVVAAAPMAQRRGFREWCVR